MALGSRVSLSSTWRMCLFRVVSSASKSFTPTIVATSKNAPMLHLGSPFSMRWRRLREIPARSAISVVESLFSILASRIRADKSEMLSFEYEEIIF